MKLKRYFAVLVVVLCGSLLFGCSGGDKNNIEINKQYYIQNLEPDAFVSETLSGFKMKTNDQSFLEFGQDFKTMWIIFTTGKSGRVDFVITSCNQNNGKLSGTATRIEANGPDKGKLIDYSFWSDSDTIFIRTLVEYKVYTVVDGAHATVTVARDMIVAEFARTAPSYIV